MDLTEIRELFEHNRFLEAYRRCAHLWAPETDTDDFSIDELILFGRLAFHVGSPRLARWLHREAARRAPRHPLTRCYALHVGRRRADILDTLIDYEAEPELDTDDPELKAFWFGSIATYWAGLRDFGNAFACLDRAKTTLPENAWVLSSEAAVLLSADRWEEALEAARRSWMVSPGKPWTARLLGQTMIKCGRLPEAARRIVEAAEAGESVELASYAAWLTCAYAETLDGDTRGRALGRASELVGRMPALTPRPDKETRDRIARASLDIAELAGDRAALEKWAEESGSHYYRTLLKNLRRSPNGRRLILPFRRVSQKHDTCLPSSMAAVFFALGMDLDEDAIAGEITYGGTTPWNAADWLERRGLAVRHFQVTPGIAAELVRTGVPFILTLEAESSAHAVAAVGLDEAAGTLLYHDPSFPRLGEILLDGLGADEHPLGPRGIAALPRDRVAFLDRIIPRDDSLAFSAFSEHGRALRDSGPPAARRVVDGLKTALPGHVVTRYLEAVQTVVEGREREAFSAFQGLTNEHPGCLRFRRSLLNACGSLGNTGLLRETLGDVVEKGRLPGIQATQDWWYPPETYVCRYADLLADSEPGRKRAFRLLRGVLARNAGSEEAWSTMGNLSWADGQTDLGRLAYRAAACLADEDDGRALVYGNVLRLDGREADGLRWLEERARRLATSPRPLGPWFAWVEALEVFGYPERTAAALEEALGTHGDDPEWVEASIPYLCRLGRWEDAEAGLRRLESRGEKTAGIHEARVVFHRLRGEWEALLHHAREWVRVSPYSMTARRQLLDAVTILEGNHVAVSLARQWVEEHPGHDEIEDLLHDRLGEDDAEGEQLRLVQERLARNTEDGWAWRALATIRIGEYAVKAPAERGRLEQEIRRTLSECDRTAPREAGTLRIHAMWAEVRGDWRAAMGHWISAVEANPEDFHSYRRAWICATSLTERERRRVLQCIEASLARCVGRLYFARELAFLIADRFGLSAAEEAVNRWRKQRPDDPEVLEAVADLWLEHGRGRSDLERAWELLTETVRRFPYHIDLRLSLAQAHRALGREAEAEEALREVHRRHPANTSVRLQIAQVRERQGDAEGAEEWLEGARAIAPLSTEVINARIGFLLRRKRTREARDLALGTLAADPYNGFRRECAINVLTDLGDPKGALELAREWVKLVPSAAYPWLMLARMLAASDNTARRKEGEECYRRALELDEGLHDAADELAQLLAKERRLEEAATVLERVRPHLKDPSPAAGRLAWLQRLSGKTAQAREAMSNVVRSAPWFGWGWEKLLTWMREDGAWDDARALLCPSPPAMQAQGWFRRDRLIVLALAGLPPTQLESEWDLCLQDYPQSVNLHLQCYDSLRELGLLDKAGKILDKVLQWVPDNPVVLARRVEVLLDRKDPKKAVETVLAVSFDADADADDDTGTEWAVKYAWEKMTDAGLLDEVCNRMSHRMERGEQPSVHAFGMMAEVARNREKNVKPCRSMLECSLFRGAGARALEKLLALADRFSWKDPAYLATIFDKLTGIGYQRIVIRYGRQYPERISATETWSEVGRALFDVSLPLTAKFLSSWKQRTDVKMWMVMNLAVSLTYFGAARYRELQSACRDALRYLSHDHTARYQAHLLAESSVLLGDTAVFRDAWSRYGDYFDGQVLDGEFFPDSRRHLLSDIPQLALALERNDRKTFDDLSKRLRTNFVRVGQQTQRQRHRDTIRKVSAVTGITAGLVVGSIYLGVPAAIIATLIISVLLFGRKHPGN